MITATYLVLVAVLGLAFWWAAARSRRARRPGSGGPAGVALGARIRSALVGIAHPDDDLVERMARCLTENTTTFGSSYAIPGHLGAELPRGVFEAADAARGPLTREVLERYREAMSERCRRLGRPEFVLPPGYTLQLALFPGPDPTLIASFEPIVDLRAQQRAPVGPVPLGPPGPVPVGPAPVGPVPAGPAPMGPSPTPPAAGDDATRRRPPVVDELTSRRATHGVPARTALLSIDGIPHAERPLGTVLRLGRGAGADLRFPDGMHEVSRLHAELTVVDGRIFVEDKHSANGTWLQHADGDWLALAPGDRSPLEPGDVVWLDTERAATVVVR